MTTFFFKFSGAVLLVVASVIAFVINKNPEKAPKSVGIETVAKKLPNFSQDYRIPADGRFSYTIEESNDAGKTWVLKERCNVLFDIKNQRLKVEKTQAGDGADRDDCHLYSVLNGVRVEYKGSLEKTSDLTGKFNGSFGGILPSPDFQEELYNCTPFFDVMAFRQRESLYLCDLFLNKKIKENVSVVEVGENRIAVTYDADNRIIIDCANGQIAEKMQGVFSEDGLRGTILGGQKVTRYLHKNGFKVPQELTGKVAPAFNEMRRSCYRIDEKSVEFNNGISLEDFAVSIPAGTFIDDNLKNTTYTLKAVLNSVEFSSVENQSKLLKQKKSVE